VIKGLIGRGLIVIAFVLSLASPSTPVFGFVVAGLLVAAFGLVCAAQRGIWLDGWHAAHDHHHIEDGGGHLDRYKRFLTNQGWS
jgi:hypothetical protein